MSIRDEFSKELNDNFPDADANGVLAILRDVLTAHGLQIVPVEPTEEMERAGFRPRITRTMSGDVVDSRFVYKAMLAADLLHFADLVDKDA